jgi:hypothetical protein
MAKDEGILMLFEAVTVGSFFRRVTLLPAHPPKEKSTGYSVRAFGDHLYKKVNVTMACPMYIVPEKPGGLQEGKACHIPLDEAVTLIEVEV